MLPIILLHGALGAAAQMQALKNALGKGQHIYCPDFSGHGHSSAQTEVFSIPAFMQDVIRMMDENNVEQADVFGYSMGGYVGLYLAQQQPQRVRKVATLGSKFFWTPEYAAAQAKLLDAETIEQKIPHFAASLAERHAGKDWKGLLKKTAAMMANLGDSTTGSLLNPEAILQPALVMVGDRDNTVDVYETEKARQSLVNARLAVLPATPHPFEKTDIGLLCLLLKNFFA